jgi:hypothetical protein
MEENRGGELLSPAMAATASPRDSIVGGCSSAPALG